MRASILNAFTGVLGFAALVSSAPQLSYGGSPDTCPEVSSTTVFVTIPAAPSTVYVTLASNSEVPTTTVTRVETLHSTVSLFASGTDVIAAQSSISSDTITSGVSYDATITQTSVVTLTQISLTATPEGASITFSETAASNGLLNFIVENGTTYWLNGQTPVSTESYVVVTSAITVVPVETAPASSAPSTLTLHTTVTPTIQVTFTETLIGPTKLTNSSAPTASLYTGLASGGWNATSTANGVSPGALGTAVSVNTPMAQSASEVYTSTANGVSAINTIEATLVTNNFPASTTTDLTLVTDFSTFDIYQISHSTISLSSLAAHSGFYDDITSYPSSTTSTVESSWTTAVINGQTVSWGGSSTSTSYIESSYVYASIFSPFVNSSTSATQSATSSVAGVIAHTDYSSSVPATSVSVNVTRPDTTSLLTAAGATSKSVGTSTSVNVSASDTESVTSSMGGVFTHSHYSFSVSSIPVSTNITVPEITASSTTSTDSGTSINTSKFANVTTVATSGSSYPPITGFTTSCTETPASHTSSVPIVSSAYNTTVSSTLVISTRNATSTSSTSATPTSCGEVGDFTLNFDDIPPLQVGTQNPNTVQPLPVFNPYHQFDFSDGFTVVPPPTDPYLPPSKPLLLEFIPNFNMNGSNPHAGPNTIEGGYSGQISDGDFGLTGCFLFNMYGASFGCDSKGPACDFTFVGYRTDAATGNETVIAKEDYSIAACPSLKNCALTPIQLDPVFSNMTGVRINVTVASQPKIWWMDDLRLGWFDNSCATGMCRLNAHIH